MVLCVPKIYHLKIYVSDQKNSIFSDPKTETEKKTIFRTFDPSDTKSF